MGGRRNFTMYTKPERDEICKSLTDVERAVFEARANGASVVQAALALSQSESTVTRRSRDVARKIERLHARARR